MTDNSRYSTVATMRTKIPTYAQITPPPTKQHVQSVLRSVERLPRKLTSSPDERCDCGRIELVGKSVAGHLRQPAFLASPNAGVRL